MINFKIKGIKEQTRIFLTLLAMILSQALNQDNSLKNMTIELCKISIRTFFNSAQISQA